MVLQWRSCATRHTCPQVSWLCLIMLLVSVTSLQGEVIKYIQPNALRADAASSGAAITVMGTDFRENNVYICRYQSLSDPFFELAEVEARDISSSSFTCDILWPFPSSVVSLVVTRGSSIVVQSLAAVVLNITDGWKCASITPFCQENIDVNMSLPALQREETRIFIQAYGLRSRGSAGIFACKLSFAKDERSVSGGGMEEAEFELKTANVSDNSLTCIIPQGFAYPPKATLSVTKRGHHLFYAAATPDFYIDFWPRLYGIVRGNSGRVDVDTVVTIAAAALSSLRRYKCLFTCRSTGLVLESMANWSNSTQLTCLAPAASRQNYTACTASLQVLEQRDIYSESFQVPSIPGQALAFVFLSYLVSVDTLSGPSSGFTAIHLRGYGFSSERTYLCRFTSTSQSSSSLVTVDSAPAVLLDIGMLFCKSPQWPRVEDYTHLQLVEGVEDESAGGGPASWRIVDSSEDVRFNFTSSGWSEFRILDGSASLSAIGGQTLLLMSVGNEHVIYTYTYKGVVLSCDLNCGVQEKGLMFLQHLSAFCCRIIQCFRLDLHASCLNHIVH